MTSPVERLWEFCCDINQNEVNDHIIVDVSGGVTTVGIDTEWLDGWHRAVDKLIGDIRDGYIALPLDADGEIIHVGDMMERGEVRRHVIAIRLSEYPKKWGGGLHWGVQLEGELAARAIGLTFHYHHAPTVKDVLREFADELHSAKTSPETFDHDKLLAEYAERLRLADDGKEQ